MNEKQSIVPMLLADAGRLIDQFNRLDRAIQEMADDDREGLIGMNGRSIMISHRTFQRLFHPDECTHSKFKHLNQLSGTRDGVEYVCNMDAFQYADWMEGEGLPVPYADPEPLVTVTISNGDSTVEKECDFDSVAEAGSWALSEIKPGQHYTICRDGEEVDFGYCDSTGRIKSEF